MTDNTNVKKKDVGTNAVEEKSADLKTEEKTAEKTPLKKSKKIKRQIQRGRAVVKCTYNNTIVSIADIGGNVLAWS